MKIRSGHRATRYLYHQVGSEPSSDDPLIGIMHTPELAALVVEAVNQSDTAPATVSIGQQFAERILAEVDHDAP